MEKKPEYVISNYLDVLRTKIQTSAERGYIDEFLKSKKEILLFPFVRISWGT